MVQAFTTNLSGSIQGSLGNDNNDVTLINEGRAVKDNFIFSLCIVLQKKSNEYIQCKDKDIYIT